MKKGQAVVIIALALFMVCAVSIQGATPRSQIFESTLNSLPSQPLITSDTLDIILAIAAIAGIFWFIMAPSRHPEVKNHHESKEAKSYISEDTKSHKMPKKDINIKAIDQVLDKLDEERVLCNDVAAKMQDISKSARPADDKYTAMNQQVSRLEKRHFTHEQSITEYEKIKAVIEDVENNTDLYHSTITSALHHYKKRLAKAALLFAEEDR